MSYRKQIRTVFFIELGILTLIGGIAFFFWSSVCPDDGSWASCLGETRAAPFMFVLYALIRPLLATPVIIITLIAGDAFGPYWGTLLAALGATLSCLLLYLPAKYIGKIHVKPFLSANLPAMWRLLRTQDYKVVFLTRWIPLFPFDFMSIVYGVCDFRFRMVLLATFLGILPECYMFARLSEDASASIISSTFYILTMTGFAVLLPLLIYEIFSRKKGTSLWNRLKGSYRELVFEIRANNEIVRRHEYVPGKIPVILLYGFFSSRRSLTVLERILQARGFQVMSFNLGGLFGVFFTRGIRESARFIDVKIKRQIRRHGFEKVHLVAHSKGGLVAMYWLLKLGGAKYCDKLITMGSPYKGSRLTYLALITPLGFIWRDVWQMRPGSGFLQELKEAPIPDKLDIYCLYSRKDKVSRGEIGLFEGPHTYGKVTPIPLDHIAHFEFLYRRDVGDVLTKLLLKEPNYLHRQKEKTEAVTKTASVENA